MSKRRVAKALGRLEESVLSEARPVVGLTDMLMKWDEAQHKDLTPKQMKALTVKTYQAFVDAGQAKALPTMNEIKAFLGVWEKGGNNFFLTLPNVEYRLAGKSNPGGRLGIIVYRKFKSRYGTSPEEQIGFVSGGRSEMKDLIMREAPKVVLKDLRSSGYGSRGEGEMEIWLSRKANE